MDPTLSFILQAGLAVLMLVFGAILNSMRTSMDQFRNDLKILNDAVLGKYVTQEAADTWRSLHLLEQTRRWEIQRTLDHELREMIQGLQLVMAGHGIGPYGEIVKTTAERK